MAAEGRILALLMHQNVREGFALVLPRLLVLVIPMATAMALL